MMPPKIDPPIETRRVRGPEPLRRKPVQPIPAPNAGRRKLLNLVLAFAAFVLLVDALVGEKGFMERMRAGREYQQQAARLDALRRENQAMLARIQRLDSDPGAIEAIAREEMGLMKKGELLFIIRDVKTATPRPAATAQPAR